MESVRSIREREVPVQVRNIDAFVASYAKSLQSLRATAHQTSLSQVQLEEVKRKLREAEGDLVKAFAALAASEGNLNESIELEDETLEAISWYNRVLGFHVDGGRGVKFTFKNINLNSPNEEYSFTIHYENNTYTLLSCEPSLEDTKELIHELNKTNGLFKFVRATRKKFQEVVVQGSLVPTAVECEESAFISASAPVLSMSYFRSDSTTEENEHEVEPTEANTHNKTIYSKKAKISRSISWICIICLPVSTFEGYDEIKQGRENRGRFSHPPGRFCSWERTSPKSGWRTWSPTF